MVSKVLQPIVYSVADNGQLAKPVLVLTITDGEPSDHPCDMIVQVMSQHIAVFPSPGGAELHCCVLRLFSSAGLQMLHLQVLRRRLRLVGLSTVAFGSLLGPTCLPCCCESLDENAKDEKGSCCAVVVELPLPSCDLPACR
jgi:hypothetical protein